MTWRTRNLYLIGLPGAGKSAIGRELSLLLRRYKYRFVDLDTEIERLAGKSIATIFREDGEPAFRALETEALLQTTQNNADRLIVSTGGGVVANALNRAIIRGAGVPIWIDVTVREAAKNVRADILHGRERPLFQGHSEAEVQTTIRALLQARRPYYEEAQLHFVTRSPRGDERTPQELAEELLTALNNMSLRVALHPKFKTIVAKSVFGAYPIFVGHGCVRELPSIVTDLEVTDLVTITDTNVEKLHAESYSKALTKSLKKSVRLHTIAIEAGEVSKKEHTLFSILQRFQEHNFSRRNTLVVGFGGGVVTDIAALAANLYHRGLPLVLIPTTLVGQADAAIGGKTAVDFFGVKNLIGTIYPPRHILIDPSFLKTLPKRELHAGLGEVFKYALIGSEALWEHLSPIVRRLVRGVDQSYEDVVYDCVKEKLQYVERDEFERQGTRELLNFGHTFGHALEAATEFRSLLHGEAVLLGMRAAAWLSKEIGHLPEESWRDIELTLGRIPVKASVHTDAAVVMSYLKKDKKRGSSSAEHRVILLRSIGQAFATTISEADATRTINYMLSLV